MIYTDTRDASVQISLKEAVINGMNAKTGGLYVPQEIPKLSPDFLNRSLEPTFRDTAYEMAKLFVENEMSPTELRSLIQDAYPFSPQVVPIDPNTYVLELFAGPTCAFKDFGARFMARLMSYFNKDEDTPLHILVATSGDTGSAVGSAFFNVQGLDVTILYPKGKISPLQEKQLCTFTGNVKALKVSGNFDDCQRLVKTAFTDKDLRSRYRLSSANSINIARLLPQAFYYMNSALLVKERGAIDRSMQEPSLIVCVPSGNFGNLTSGLIARAMGAPITGFIAATNSNHTMPDYLCTGEYKARPSVATLSNAMDVGDPSNFERIKYMYTLQETRAIMASYWLDDKGTLEAINQCHTKTGYVIDPHGAVAWQAWNDIKNGAMKDLLEGKKNNMTKPGLSPFIPGWTKNVNLKNMLGIVLETAHPAKFGSIVKEATGVNPVLPDRLEKVLRLKDNAQDMSVNYAEFKDWFINNHK